MNLALFDFDNTITTKGMYRDFLRFSVLPRRARICAAFPKSDTRIARLISNQSVRLVLSWCAFQGDSAARIRDLGLKYATDVVPAVVRQSALERIEWHKQQGDRVVVVSASLDAYLNPWCEALGVEVICTQLEEKGGRLTGKYVHGDCCGAEKARRIRERYNLGQYARIYAYGDSEEDREMLDLAHEQYYRWKTIDASRS